ncbi:MAG: radical SAM protein, partial [Acidobacteriota bacterium]
MKEKWSESSMDLKGKRRGRGAVGNPAGRFESSRTVPFHDGWNSLEGPPPSLPTQVTPEKIRSIISRNDSPDIPFSQSINPYRGCEHGCIYCFARPTHSYLGLSPGLDFETRLFSKPEAPEQLRKELRRPGYRCRMIALGSNTDPYQPVERRLGLTRQIISVMREFRHPFCLVTKSDLILRDLDLLAELARAGLVYVMISLTTLDP